MKLAINLAAATLSMTPNIALAHTGETYVVCNLNADGFARLHSCAAADCDVLMSLPLSTAVRAIAPYSGSPWRDVEVLGGAYMLPIGPDGWVNDKFLCEIAD